MELNNFGKGGARKPVYTDTMELWSPVLVELWEEVKSELSTLGPDVQVIPTKSYISFKRKRVFAFVLPQPFQKVVVMTVKVNPDTVKLEPGFTRDVRTIRGVGSGDLEIIISNHQDLEKAKPLLLESYAVC